MSTILVTDAEPQIRHIIGRLLEAEGHVCIFASDGEDALRVARESRPDLVLIDVEMPRCSGLEVLAALRQDEGTRATRVILTCAGVRPTEEDERAANADGLVMKPFDSDHLVSRVREALLRGPRRRSAVPAGTDALPGAGADAARSFTVR